MARLSTEAQPIKLGIDGCKPVYESAHPVQLIKQSVFPQLKRVEEQIMACAFAERVDVQIAVDDLINRVELADQLIASIG